MKLTTKDQKSGILDRSDLLDLIQDEAGKKKKHLVYKIQEHTDK